MLLGSDLWNLHLLFHLLENGEFPPAEQTQNECVREKNICLQGTKQQTSPGGATALATVSWCPTLPPQVLQRRRSLNTDHDAGDECFGRRLQIAALATVFPAAVIRLTPRLLTDDDELINFRFSDATTQMLAAARRRVGGGKHVTPHERRRFVVF